MTNRTQWPGDVPAQVVILSGAGLSADSGIPTFRGAGGMWENHSVNQVANYLTWKQNFELVHQFYNERRAQLETIEPNDAHRMVASLQASLPTHVLTQNIDDVLEKAGCTDVIHLHGRADELRCEACGHHWSIGYAAWDPRSDRCPRCPSRKGVKPGVVFFHEPAPRYADMHRIFRSLRARDVLVVIGTSGLVIDVNAFVFDCPARKILNNLEASEHINAGYFDHVFYDGAAAAAPHIERLVRQLAGQL